MKLRVLHTWLFIVSAASEDCAAVPHTDPDSLLQVVRRASFCSKFFGEKNQGVVNRGLQETKTTFNKYCLSADIFADDCEKITTNLFDNATGMFEELCEKLMAEQEVDDVPGGTGVSMDVTPRLKRGEPGGEHNMRSPQYAVDEDLVQIAAVRFRLQEIPEGPWFSMCAEAGSARFTHSTVRTDLRSFITDSMEGQTEELEDVPFPNVCGPAYNDFYRSDLYNVSYFCDFMPGGCGNQINIYYATTPDLQELYKMRRTHDQSLNSTDTRIVLAKFWERDDSRSYYYYLERCAEIGSAPNEGSIDENSEWLVQNLRTNLGGDLQTEVVREWNKYHGYACGPYFNDWIRNYTEDERTVHIWEHS